MNSILSKRSVSAKLTVNVFNVSPKRFCPCKPPSWLREERGSVDYSLQTLDGSIADDRRLASSGPFCSRTRRSGGRGQRSDASAHKHGRTVITRNIISVVTTRTSSAPASSAIGGERTASRSPSPPIGRNEPSVCASPAEGRGPDHRSVDFAVGGVAADGRFPTCYRWETL